MRSREQELAEVLAASKEPIFNPRGQGKIRMELMQRTGGGKCTQKRTKGKGRQQDWAERAMSRIHSRKRR